jgi:hypothetical protein
MPGPGFAAEPGGYAAPGTGFGYAAPGDGRPVVGATPAAWRLVLSAGAKRLVAVFLGLGVLLAAAYIAGLAALATHTSTTVSNRVTANNAAVQVQADAGPLNQALNASGTTTSQCRTSARRFSCVTAADRSLGASFDVFAAQLQQISMPPGASQAAAGQLENAAARAGLIFRRLAATNSAARYQAVLTTFNLDQAMNRFDQDYQALGNALNHV